MRRRTIQISGTSFLMPSHPAWKASEFNFQFMHFGQIEPLKILEEEPWLAVIVLSFNDIFENNKYDLSKSSQLMDLWIEELNAEAKKKNTKILIISVFEVDKNFFSELRQPDANRDSYEGIVKALISLCKKNPDIHFVNANHLFSSLGFEKFMDDRNWYFARCRFSFDGIKKIVQFVHSFATRLTHEPKKVLVLDCDNTLWGGVVGEDGVGGIILGGDGAGKIFQDFQLQVKKLAESGVLIGLISKNTFDDVYEVFDKHTEMILSWNDIIGYRINWEEKWKNIESLSKDLGLGLNAFSFWDDNPFERESMKVNLPSVETIDPPEEIEHWPRFLAKLESFSGIFYSTEDMNKTGQYKLRNAFIEGQKSAGSQLEFLKSLQARPESLPVSEVNAGRAAQLTSKTNQFNLRKEPMSIASFQKYEDESKGFARIIRLTDRFGDHGQVGLFGISIIEKEIAEIEIFILSCRVIGRNLEKFMLSEILEYCSGRGINTLLAEFSPNGRNEMVKKFLLEENFQSFKLDLHLSNLTSLIGEKKGHLLVREVRY